MKLQPGSSRDPLPWVILALIVQNLLSKAGDEVAQEAARASLIQFDTYCRPCEAVGLKIANVIAPVLTRGDDLLVQSIF